MTFAFTLLTLAVLAVWLPPLQLTLGRSMLLWMPRFIASVMAAYAAGLVLLGGIPALAAFGALVYGVRVAKKKWIRYALLFLYAAMAIALSMHLIAGFANPKIIDNIQLSDGTAAYSLYFNFDKETVGLLLLAWLCKPFQNWTQLRQVAARSILWGLPATSGVMALA